MQGRFSNRRDAGQRLAGVLERYQGDPNAIVLALPRGGVPIGFEVAGALGIPLDVFVVRKLGLPWHEELAMGALASGGVRVLDDDLIRAARVSPDDILRITADEQAELNRRERRYRGSRAFPSVHGKTVILVDDGLATGSTMRAAVTALRRENPSRVVVAVPVAAREACDAVGTVADEIVCVVTPPHFQSVGQWYDDFAQTSDDEVHALLEKSRAA
jgi:putative phosphoribosyl transferase